MSGFFTWCDSPVAFRTGETIAAALIRAQIRELGHGAASGRYFCGIGLCQGCVVLRDGTTALEACITPAVDGMKLEPTGGRR